MIHDPLCPLTSCVGPVCYGNDCTCQCDMIGKAERRGFDARDADWQTRQLDIEEMNLNRHYEQGQRDGHTTGYRAAMDDARQAVAETHQPIPVIQCACGWGANCPECGSDSNQVVGHVCRVCCADWGDHGYCDDMHNEDDTPLHHVGEEMWSGPFCPVIAAIESLRKLEP